MGLLGAEVLDDRFVTDARERAVVEAVRALAAEFAERAERYDREAAFPEEDFRALARAKLMALRVPAAYGGSGLGSAAYVAAICEMAKGDGSTALAYNMHATALAVIDLLANEEQKRRWFGRVVESGARVAALASEPNLKPFTSGEKPRTVLERRGAGFVLRGRKSYGSFGPHADLLYVTATFEGRVVSVMVDSGSPGIVPRDDWDVMSMRATSSVTMEFHDTPVDPADVVVPRDQAFALLLELEYALGYPPIYLGIAEVAYRAARDAWRATLDRGAPPGATAFDPDAARAIAQLGEMRLLFEPAWLMAQRAALTEPLGSFERGAALAGAKAVACDTACAVAAVALRAAGGRGLSGSSPVQRAFRDVQAGIAMAFPPDQVRVMLGLLEVGRPPAFVAALASGPPSEAASALHV
jgi:alkylation response protein AidB-like acyl-CoA dehydrogenase